MEVSEFSFGNDLAFDISQSVHSEEGQSVDKSNFEFSFWLVEMISQSSRCMVMIAKLK